MSAARGRTVLATAAAAFALVVTLGDPFTLFARAAEGGARDAGPQDAAGAWRGAIMGLPLTIRLERSEEGAWTGLLDSPNQGVTNFPLDGIRVTADSLSFALTAAGARYEGARVADDSLAGTWTQAGRSLPLALRTATRPRVRPAPGSEASLPYRAEEVSYERADAGIRVAGTLTIPPGDGPFPAAILVTGSGAENRDEEIFGHKPFLVLADDLTRRGVAVLRVDDRGVGGSTGSLAGATLLDLADDVNAGVAFLRGRREIAPDRVGIVGHSEGGLVAVLAAERANAPPAYAVLLSAPAVPLDSILRMQSAILGASAGFAADRMARERALYERLHRTLQEPGDSAAVAPRVVAIVEELLAPLPEEALRGAGGKEAVAARQAATVLTPSFRYFIRYDPEPALARLRIPVLALFGEKDTQVPAVENAGAAERILRGAKHPDATVRTLAGLNHIYQTATTGLISEYGSIEETFAPAALDTIGAWIATRTGAKGAAAEKPSAGGSAR